MNERSIEITASIGLFIGGIFGMVGSFVASPSLRSLAWGIDGVGLVLASAYLTIYYFRKGLDGTSAGFLIFAIGEGFILASSGLNLELTVTAFGAGTSLWATALFVISIQKTFPLFIRCTGALAAILFSVTAALIFTGHPIHALTKPLPFFAYPVFMITLFGWAWTLLHKRSGDSP